MIKISYNKDDGSVEASNGVLEITTVSKALVPKVFKRRAVKKLASGELEEVEWLVCELGGIRVYIDKEGIVMTDMDLNP